MHTETIRVVDFFVLFSCSKEANADWLFRLFHSCNRVQKYAESEMLQVYLTLRRKFMYI